MEETRKNRFWTTLLLSMLCLLAFGMSASADVNRKQAKAIAKKNCAVLL